MRKKNIFILFFAMWSVISDAQSKRDREWISGVLYSNIISYLNGNFQFNRFVDTATGNTTYYFGHGATNICDTTGRLFLASNGFNVMDSNKSIVDGLDSIGGRDFMKLQNGFTGYCQYSIFLPMADGIYYFVNNSVSNEYLAYYNSPPAKDFDFDELMFTKIDMQGNGGAGSVLQREIKIIEKDTLRDTQMMACRHANGKDWWLFKQGVVNNRLHKFLFTQDSVYNYGTQNIADPIFSKWDHGGQSMFSQDGAKYASTNRGAEKIYVADFDRCTGVLSNPKVYPVPILSAHNPNDSSQTDTFSEGLAFSPNGRFVYVYMYFNIQQLDLWDSDTSTQWSVVAGLDTTWEAFQSYSGMYLGPDSKLYIGNWAGLSKQMSYFNNPDAKGLGSNFCPRCLRFPILGAMSPPTMPNYDLGEETCWPLANSQFELERESLEIYPNPASSFITLSCEAYRNKTQTIQLVDLLGQTVLSKECNFMQNTYTLDVQHIKQGVYFVKLGNYMRKVVIE